MNKITNRMIIITIVIVIFGLLFLSGCDFESVPGDTSFTNHLPCEEEAKEIYNITNLMGCSKQAQGMVETWFFCECYFIDGYSRTIKARWRYIESENNYYYQEVIE